MKRPRVHVTEHALLRYLERVMGLDVAALRLEIARTVDRAAEAGARAVTIAGHRYVLDFRADGAPIVVTVEPAADWANKRRCGLRTGGGTEAEPDTCAVPGCGNAVSDRNETGLCQIHGGRSGGPHRTRRAE
jgi:hypothetical protein